MKFYVTGRSSEYELVKETCAKLKASGHKITFEWTELPMVKPYSEYPKEAAEFAVQGIQGVIDADVYIIFAHPDGNGLFTEFGAALASNMKNDAPRIFVIGEPNFDWGMFYAHPAIIWKDNIDEAITEYKT